VPFLLLLLLLPPLLLLLLLLLSQSELRQFFDSIMTNTGASCGPGSSILSCKISSDKVRSFFSLGGDVCVAEGKGGARGLDGRHWPFFSHTALHHVYLYTVRFPMRAGFGGLSTWWQQEIGSGHSTWTLTVHVRRPMCVRCKELVCPCTPVLGISVKANDHPPPITSHIFVNLSSILSCKISSDKVSERRVWGQRGGGFGVSHKVWG
jgi:hypothetical protein